MIKYRDGVKKEVKAEKQGDRVIIDVTDFLTADRDYLLQESDIDGDAMLMILNVGVEDSNTSVPLDKPVKM